MGSTAAEGTAWTSDSFVLCKVAGGLEGSSAVAFTGGQRLGTETDAGSYDLGWLSAASGSNVGKTGGVSLSLSGVGFGSRR